MYYERTAPIDSIPANTSIPPRREYAKGDWVSILNENGESIGPFKITLRLDAHHYWIRVPELDASDCVYAEASLRPFVSDFAGMPLGTYFNRDNWPITKITSIVKDRTTGDYVYQALLEGLSNTVPYDVSAEHARKYPHLIEEWRNHGRSLLDRIASTITTTTITLPSLPTPTATPTTINAPSSAVFKEGIHNMRGDHLDYVSYGSGHQEGYMEGYDDGYEGGYDIGYGMGYGDGYYDSHSEENGSSEEERSDEGCHDEGYDDGYSEDERSSGDEAYPDDAASDEESEGVDDRSESDYQSDTESDWGE
ncbi:hypothetical protein DFP72DRAFT_843215 [Ephemerocybe angulata]|uniref:Uncharacterized protein n=1 Tax=Ephemerocybe angulata TaxID=980116 RepID=A0A8H6IB63_9AGAR|nr:hypothetical protein DFP72DRAFT_843215 [Tulosesus angulatus]